MTKLRLLLCLLFLSCSSQEPSKEKERLILVSIPPYATIIKSLVDSTASIATVVPPGANPHLYEPTPEQSKYFSRAQIWFRMGDPAEEKLAAFLKARHVKIVNLSQKKGERGGCGCHPERDLHLWLDPQIAISQVREISEILTQEFPDIASVVLANRELVIKRLEALDQKASLTLAPLQNKSLLTSHSAFGYFCKRYHLHELSIEADGKDPLPQTIVRLMQTLKENPVPVVFTQPQHNNKGALLIAENLGIPTAEIDPYTENYFELLDNLPDLIADHYAHPDR